MQTSPSTRVGGWEFQPWESAVLSHVAESHRPYFLSAARCYTSWGEQLSEPYAAVPVEKPSLEPHRLMQALAYAVMASGNQDAARGSFLIEPIAYPGDDLAGYPHGRPMDAPKFYVETGSLMADLATAVAGLSARLDASPSAETSGNVHRVATAIEWYLTARWWMADTPEDEAALVLAFGIALECLFTEMRRKEAEREADKVAEDLVAKVRAAPESISTGDVARGLDELLVRYAGLRSYPRIKETLKARLATLAAGEPGATNIWGSIGDWVDSFYRLRSDIVHGRRLGPECFQYKGMSHIGAARLILEWLVWDSLVPRCFMWVS